jgi:IS5 family transposase
MRQERTIQATIFEVFARHQIGCELKAVSAWLDGQRALELFHNESPYPAAWK